MKPCVSVIIPVYGVEKLLPRCMNSVLSQSLRNIEIILVDDESPDNCPQMCDEYAKSDKRVKVIHKKNGGLGFARNSGLEIATGEYVTFLDSDDYVSIDSYEILYRTASQNNVDVVLADKFNESEEGKVTNSIATFPIKEGYYSGTGITNNLLFPMFGMLPNEGGDKYLTCSSVTNIYKLDILNDNGVRFDSERNFISEDLLFMLKVLHNVKSAYVLNKRFYHYVVNSESLTHTYRADRFEKEIVLYHECSKRLQELGYYSECKIRLYRNLINRVRKVIKRELYGNPNFLCSLRNTNQMLKAKELRIIFAEYDVSAMPIKHQIVFYLMKYRLVLMIRLLRAYL